MLLSAHVVAGSLAMLLGAVALLASKGGRLHRRAGLVFVSAMLVMGVSGSVLALRHSFTNANVLGGVVCSYFVTTALTTVRRESVWVRRLNIGALIVALALVGIEVRVGWIALKSPSGVIDGIPFYGAPLFVMATIIALAAIGDVRVLRREGNGAPPIARHLWRMCFALFIATGSFFSIPERVARILPSPLTVAPVRLLPMVLPFVAMSYWLWRVRGSNVDRSTGTSR